MIKNNRQE
uniref:Uncharacterized protein n=1 Tax=Rhizophora mucronata TaxID=61149 RepID=A0A2P2JIX1_RHIMU